MKRASFFCLATHDLRVVLQTIDAMKDHPAQDATSKGARLVVREVAACGPRQIALWSAAIPFPDLQQGELLRRWKCLACG